MDGNDDQCHDATKNFYTKSTHQFIDYSVRHSDEFVRKRNFWVSLL
jgi:hypothetical protein